MASEPLPHADLHRFGFQFDFMNLAMIPRVKWLIRLNMSDAQRCCNIA